MTVDNEKYLDGRRQYSRPQALLFSNNPGYISNGKTIPEGNEFEDFIILSDDNRGSISVASQRIEKRERTINGRMRSYHIADKTVISTDWTNLPSRAFNVIPSFQKLEFLDSDIPAVGKITNLVTEVDIEGTDRPVKSSGSPFFKDQQFTSDGGAGGADLLKWYKENQGSFWVFLAYDNHYNFDNERNRLKEYSEVTEVFFASFEHSIEKRGGENFDFWNISMSLEEV
jgi:hypothetical protein